MIVMPGRSIACTGKHIDIHKGSCAEAGMRLSAMVPDCCQGQAIRNKGLHVTANGASTGCCNAQPVSSAPCSGHCGDNCHCTAVVMATLLPGNRPVLPVPAFHRTAVKPAVAPIVLPAGFAFIWRPPKIGSAFSVA